MASTIVILNSSVISDMNVDICFMRRSTLPSFPVLSSVVIAKVAMDRLEFEMSDSISGLQGRTADGLKEATVCRIRTAANLVTGRGEDKNICRVWIAWVISPSVTSRRLQIALTASKLTISLLCRSQPSRSCSIGLRRPWSSSANFAASLTSITTPGGLFTTPGAPSCWTILTKAILSWDRI